MGPLGFETNITAASTIAHRVDALFYTLLALSFVIAFGICFVLVWFAVKYRRGSSADRTNPPAANLKVELTWIIIPMLLSIGIFAWAGRVYVDMFNAPPGAIEINVVGKQWMWKIQHPEGQREINELHVPVGKPVKLNLISQDVIHDFYVPAFRIKQDVLPDRYTTTWFQATKPGRYHLFCSQYCGLYHAQMGGWVVVMPPADYAKWLSASNQGQTMTSAGAKLFLQMGCAGCHSEGSTVRAPTLNGLYGKPVPLQGGGTVTADDRYITDSILEPKKEVVAGYKPVMPSFRNQATPEQVMELLAFIRSLANVTPGEGMNLGNPGGNAGSPKPVPGAAARR
jgi:cytochrome c oxidase subunit 2